MGVLSSLAASYESSFNSSSSSTTDTAAALAFIGAYFVFVIVIYLVFSFILSKVFAKAKQPAWAAFVPIYNTWVLFEIAGKPGWWALLIIPSFIPLVGLLFSIALAVMSLLAALELAKRFGKSQAFAILGLWLFSIIGYAILAFDDSKYQGVAASGASPSPGNNPSPASANTEDNQ